jgi:hypothetical protein
MSRVDFERTIPVFERAKTVHALDHAATVIGYITSLNQNNQKTEVKETLPNTLTLLHFAFAVKAQRKEGDLLLGKEVEKMLSP